MQNSSKELNRGTFRLKNNHNICDIDFIKLCRKIIDSGINLTIDKSFLVPNGGPPVNYSIKTIFNEIEVAPFVDIVPEQYKYMNSPIKEFEGSIDEFISKLKTATKNYIYESWDPKIPHLIMCSAGLDSRIMSLLIKELHMEHGDKWLGKVHFRCHNPEDSEFNTIMKLQGWTEDQYSGYNYRIDKPFMDNVPVNGFVPYYQQMCWWNDIVSEHDEKNWSICAGTAGSEMFNFQQYISKLGKIKYTNNPKLNVMLAIAPENGEMESSLRCRFKSVIQPFLSFEFLAIALSVRPEFCESKNLGQRSSDIIRIKMIESIDKDIMNVPYLLYPRPSYTWWELSDKKQKELLKQYYDSKFYKDCSKSFGNIDPFKEYARKTYRGRYGLDGRLLAFSQTYQKIYE